MGHEPERRNADGAMVERLTRAARAAQQLCDALWESLHEELHAPRAERIKELSERLGEVSSTVAMLADVTRASSAERHTQPEPVLRDCPPGPTSMPELRLAPHASPSERPTAPEASVGAPPLSTPLGDHTATRLLDERDPGRPVEPFARVEPLRPAIEIRDARLEEGSSAWVSSVGRLLERHSEDGLPFAVLLVEVLDVARLERSEAPREMTRIISQVESALCSGMRLTDELSRENLGRYWLVTPETNGTGARMLAERLVRLVRSSATHRGVGLEVAIGIAVCPGDGTEVPTLAARADLGVYSARATGRSIAHTEPPA